MKRAAAIGFALACGAPRVTGANAASGSQAAGGAREGPQGRQQEACLAEGAAPRDVVLLQARTTRTLAKHGSDIRSASPAPPEVAWVAHPFGDCVDRCGEITRKRVLECRTLFGDVGVDAGSCASMVRPHEREQCSCGDSPCVTEGPCDISIKAVVADPEGVPEHLFHVLGCLPADPSPTNSSTAFDYTCLNATASHACGGGLPFYRMRSNALSSSLCYSFCIGKGLDLFGVTASEECRCGASALNKAIWHGEAPRVGFSFPLHLLTPDHMEEACPIRVFRYTGHFEDGGVPFELTEPTVQDEAYVDSLVLGRLIEPETEEDSAHPAQTAVTVTAAPLALGSFRQRMARRYGSGRADPGWTRSCWPGNCGAGGGPWQQRRATLLAGIAGKWEEYAVIRYFFDPALDATRKAAFREAAAAWGAVSCVHFVEAAAEPGPPAVLVDAYEPDQCYATNIGFPGENAYSVVNVGWCSSDRYIGNIIHELGHVLGMNHEQKRPDAVARYHGHGPHLDMKWENVGDEWTDQYTSDPKSYVGSIRDGAGDPHSGYAWYDFGSIMHYPAGDHFDTLPREDAVLTGNRRSLTDGDILQILDAYQCKEK